MKQKIFREKDIDNLSEAQRLGSYIKVANPTTWLILAAIFIFLIGVCIWAFFAKVETVIESAGVCQNGVLTCYIKEEEATELSQSPILRVDGEEIQEVSFSNIPVMITKEEDPYAMHIGELKEGDWVYKLTGRSSLSDGTYRVVIVAERVSPIHFVWN